VSSALAIAAVTASIKDLLNEGLLNHDLSTVGSFSVTSQPPDRVSTGTTETNQLNVFLYQVTPNSGWRNTELPSRDNRGARLTNPPLALDLHYLLTAYGAQDLNAEILLGYAMQLLHETPMLTRDQLRTVLGAPSPVDGEILPGPFGSLSAVDLADQVELIKITPAFLSSEELSRLWTAMQARYRPSMGYLVSVVLITSDAATRSALPVLKRGPDDRGPVAQAAPGPVLQAIRSLASPLFPALRLGDDVALSGSGLSQEGTLSAVFDCPRLDISLEVPLTPGPTASELRAHLPAVTEDTTVMNAWAAGVYTVSIRVTQPGMSGWLTNGVPVALAPRITASPLTGTTGDAIDLVLTCTPRLRPVQEAQVRLLFGSTEMRAASIDTPADLTQPSTLHFSIPAPAAGNYLLRLRVDGIDSLPVTVSGSPPTFAFDAAQTVTVS
jgi:hypothetical protein